MAPHGVPVRNAISFNTALGALGAWSVRKRSLDGMEFPKKPKGFHGDFYGISMGFHGDFYGDLMGVHGDLMGF